MKKTLILCIILSLSVISIHSYAQAPQGFKYQSVARNTSGLPIASSNIGLRIRIHDQTETGTVVYSETHTAATNAFGVFSLSIGGGTPQSGTFNTIDWGTGAKFIEIEADFSGGTSYTSMGASQLLSVPYALYSENGTPGPQGPAGLQGSAGPQGPQGIQGLKGDDGNSGVAFDDVQVLTDKTWTSSKIDSELSAKVNTADISTVGTTGSYNDLIDQPTLATVASSGDYDDLVNKPILFTGDYADLTGIPGFSSVATSGDYNDLLNKPLTDGSETKLNAGSNISITGIGTTGSPYVLNTTSNGWGLAGNSGTVDGTDFIGTTDNKSLEFRTNNILRARINTKGQLETFNTGKSVFVGEGAGANDDLTDNQNVFVGYEAGNSNTTAEGNTGSGIYALKSNTTGSYNTGIGLNALYANTTGLENTAVGIQSLQSNTDGIKNTGIGSGALVTSTGNYNTAIGASALTFNYAGSNNTAIGSNADVSFNGSVYSNATAIGANAMVTASNAVQLGDRFVTQVFAGTGTRATLITGGLKITGGAPATGKVLTSDATGIATWQAAGGSGWGLTGNSGTVEGTNFIGTSDDKSLSLKVNNQTRLFLSNESNGIGSLGKVGINTITPAQLFHIKDTEVPANFLDDDGDGLIDETEHELVFTNYGRLGIGTSAPSASLDIMGNIKITDGTQGAGKVLTSDATGVATWQTASGGGLTGSGTLNYLPKFTPDGTSLGNSLIFDDGSYVGIGTATPTYLFDVRANTVSAAVNFENANPNGWALRAAATGSGYGVYGQSSTGIGIYGTASTGKGVRGYATGSGGYGIQGLAINGAYAGIFTGGNVGIGTLTPVASLDILGTIKISDGSQGAGKVLTSDANGLATWQTAGGGSGWGLTGNSGTVDGTNFIGTTDNVPLSFRVANQKAGRIEFSSYNTFFGRESGNVNSTGSVNTANGAYSLASNTTGTRNTAIGVNTLVNSSTGINNTAVGVWALNNSTGDYNTAVGVDAISSSTGNNNTAIGNTAGKNITTGSNNTAIGNNAQVPLATTSNQIRIGDTDITYAGVQVAWTVTSDKRWKSDIKQSNLGLDFITNLKPVSYFRNNDKSKKREYGFIAQDLEETLKASGVTDSGIISKDDKGMLSVRYNDLMAPIVKAMQEQQLLIQELQSKIETLEQEASSSKKLVGKLEIENTMIKSDFETRLKKLEEMISATAKR